jgi:hypothetical protein
MIKKKIMMMPWRVNRESYVLAPTICLPGAMSSILISNPITTPTRKKERIE